MDEEVEWWGNVREVFARHEARHEGNDDDDDDHDDVDDNFI